MNLLQAPFSSNPISMKYWLLKTEPGTYAFSQLLKDRSTNWNGIRNYQARNFLKEAKVGDIALIYHSGDEKSVVGTATISREAYPDKDPEDPKADWVQVDLKAGKALKTSISLKTLKAHPTLKELLLVKQSRLSVSPVTSTQFKALLALSGAQE